MAKKVDNSNKMDISEFFLAFADLLREKGIAETDFIETLKVALTAGYKKQKGYGAEVQMDLNAETGTMECKAVRYVVEEVQDKDKEIALEDALEENPNLQVGDVIEEKFNPAEFGRIAAQTVKQVVFQKVHEAERDNTFSAFSDKEGELMEGTIRKIDDRNVYVKLDNKIEGVMPPQDRVPGESYAEGDKIKVFVKRVRNSGKTSQIVVSRTSAGLVEKLFAEQVPEMQEGTVVVKSITREPGQRTKMAIYSTDPKVDAVGSCVGNKGSRVNAVVAELGGEKIDIITWSENPLEFIAKALSPATVVSVTERGEKSAVAVVPDDKLSLAIGRNGQNARLAARLTGWKIDVKSESVAEELNLVPTEEETEEGME